MQTSATQDFHQLDPETLLAAVESLSFLCDARLLTLNSYENRVYRVGLEDKAPIIAKFYRPHRWSDAQICEEHQLTLELAEQEIPVIAPLTIAHRTLFHYQQFRFSIYPLTAGHAPELDNMHHLEWLGRSIGRMHLVNQRQPFQTRPHIDLHSYVDTPIAWIQEQGYIPLELAAAYRAITQALQQRLRQVFDTVTYRSIRLHGDCHIGNILWSQDSPHFVDFDDSRMGPAVQDLWMLLSGYREEQTGQLQKVLKGYTQFCDFDLNELQLIEPLRTLRIIHYAGWLAQRWSDPAFPVNFPWFNTIRYWEEHILQLKEQMALLDEEPLTWMPDYD